MQSIQLLKNKILWTVMVSCFTSASYAQHHDAETQETSGTTGKENAFKAGPIMKQALTDPGLKGYLYNASIMELAPGFIDTVAHRHDAELFVYVLEGTIETQLENNAPQIYTKGQMFYEHPNVLHTLLRNLSPSEPAKLMLNFIIKEGRHINVNILLTKDNL